MLVLSRRHGETIMVGDAIELVVLHVQGDRVKLGVAAPREIAVRRSELPESDKGMTSSPGTPRRNQPSGEGPNEHFQEPGASQ